MKPPHRGGNDRNDNNKNPLLPEEKIDTFATDLKLPPVSQSRKDEILQDPIILHFLLCGNAHDLERTQWKMGSRFALRKDCAMGVRYQSCSKELNE